MSYDIQYTTGPKPRPNSTATADTGTAILLVVPPATVLAADAETRQRIALAAKLPWHSVERIAHADIPVVVGAVQNDRLAKQRADELLTQHDLVTSRVESAAITNLGVAIGGVFVSAMAAIGVLATSLIAGGGTLPLLVGLLGVVALFVGLWSGRTWYNTRHDYTRVSSAWKEQRDAIDPATREQLCQVRALSLVDELPVETRVGLWTKLERAEKSLDAGGSEGTELAEIMATVEKMLPRVRGPEAEQILGDMRANASRASTSMRTTR